MTEASKPLGVIQMANTPLRFPGNLGNPDSYGFPVTYTTASAAYTDRILARDAAVTADYIEEGRKLEQDGVRAVITTCGFNIINQDEMARELTAAVATSSLLLLPLLLRIAGGNRPVGVITYDCPHLTDDMLLMAGVTEADLGRVRICGLDGTETWRQLALPEPDLPLETARADLYALILELFEHEGELGGILLECSALCPFAPDLRERFGIPVFDFLSLAQLVRDSVSETRSFGDEGRAR